MIKLCKSHAVEYLEGLEPGETFMVEYTDKEKECEHCINYRKNNSKSGVGLLVYYDVILYCSEWCETVQEAFDKYYNIVSKEIIDDDNLMDVDFEWVTVKLVYSYDEFMNEVGEAL